VQTPSPAPPATPPPLPPALVTPPRSHPPPIGPPPLHCGEREHRAPFRPGNIYGEHGQPSKQVKEIKRESTWKRLVGKEPPKAPDTPNVPGGLPPSPTPSEDDVNRLTREGGDALTSYLCSHAIPYVESAISPNYWEWSYHDIQKLPADEQALWRKACETELSMLKERKVWEVTDRPIDRKIIKNCWVFDVKTDGRKKARLVAKGFSQVEGVDYDQIFSPVVRFETVQCMFALATLQGWHISGLDV
jgi:hypothetical protein